MELMKYDEARKALAICASIDEVKDIQDKSEAMRLYAKMSENTELEVYASTIKLRAQVRLGEIIAAMESGKGGRSIKTGSNGGTSKKESLSAAGISKTSAFRYEQAASIPEQQIETIINKAVTEQKPITITKILSDLKPSTPKGNQPPTPEPENKPEAKPGALTGQSEQSTELEMLRDIVAEYQAEAEALEKILDSDDKLSESIAEIKRLNGVNATIRSQLDGANNKNNELIGMVKSLKKQVARLEKELLQYQIEELPL